MMIETKTYKGTVKDKTLLILGAIHGNETCGTYAIHQLMKDIEGGELTLDKGTLILVPICNPKAYEQNKRYIDVNLNRVIGHHDNPTAYEHYLGAEIATLIDQADYVLDLHSVHGESVPFVFQDAATIEEETFAQSMHLENIIVGWPDIYKDDVEAASEITTQTYAGSKNIPAITVECGTHGCPKADKLAVECIYQALDFLNMARIPNLKAKPVFTKIVMDKYIRKEQEGVMEQHWIHMDKVAKGTILAHYANGEILKAADDCFILLPFHEAQIGDEWFYIGKAN